MNICDIEEEVLMFQSKQKEICQIETVKSQTSIKKNTIFNAIKTLFSIVFPLITFPYVNRILLPDNTGKINFANSIVSYFSLVASLGITTYAIRECSRVKDDKDKLSNTASQIFTINSLTTLLAYFGLAITLLINRSLDNYRTLIIIQSLTIVSSTLGADWLNSAMEDFKYLTIRTIACQVVGLGLMFAFVHKPDDYIVYAVICLISSAGANIINIWYRRKFCTVRILWKIKSEIAWKKHILPILYLFVMLLAQTIFNSIDTTMLGLMINDREVGIYSTAHKMIGFINQIVASLLWVIMPRMSYYFEKGDYTQINRLLRKVLGFNISLGLPIVIGGIILSNDLVVVFAGPEFSEAGSVLQILLVGFLFSLVGGNFLGNAVLLPSKQEKYYMVVCCATAIVNVVSNYIFIPLYGAKAAAGTTAACSLLIMVLLILRIDNRISIAKPLRLITPSLLGSIGIAIVCVICRGITNIWLRLAFSFLFSFIIYGFTQVLLKNELIIELIDLTKKRFSK